MKFENKVKGLEVFSGLVVTDIICTDGRSFTTDTDKYEREPGWFLVDMWAKTDDAVWMGGIQFGNGKKTSEITLPLCEVEKIVKYTIPIEK